MMKRGGGSILRRCSSSSRSQVELAASTQSNTQKFSNLADMLKFHGCAEERSSDTRPAGAWKPSIPAELNEPKNLNLKGTAEQKLIIQSEIKRGIAVHLNRVVFDAFNAARDARIELDIRDLVSILNVCTKRNATDAAIVIAYKIYGHLKKVNCVPVDVFCMVMAVCAQHRDGVKALEVARDQRQSACGPPTEKFMYNLLMAITSCVEPIDNFSSKMGPTYPRKQHVYKMICRQDIDHYYNVYLKVSKECGWATDPKIFVQVTTAYSLLRERDSVLLVLNDMTEHGHVPPVEFCEYLMNHGLFDGDVKLLRVLCTWFADEFKERPERGIISRNLQLASAEGDGLLAGTAIKLLIKHGYSVDRSDYLCCAHACLGDDDVMGTLDALIEAQRNGVDLLVSQSANRIDGGFDTDAAGLMLQDVYSEKLSRSVKRLDEVYYALVDLLRSSTSEDSTPVPRLALNAVIMAAGRMGQLDRAFATFQEYTGLFGLKADTEAHNALLYATARAKQPSATSALTVLQTMEGAGCQPDAISYGLLLEVMVEVNNVEMTTEVLAHVESIESPDLLRQKDLQRSLRRVMSMFARKDMRDYVEVVAQLATKFNIRPAAREEMQDEGMPPVKQLSLAYRKLPRHFQKRLEYIEIDLARRAVIDAERAKVRAAEEQAYEIKREKENTRFRY